MCTAKVSLIPGFFLLITITLPRLAWSQPIEITASEFDFNQGSTTIHKIFGHDPDSYFVLKYFGGQYHLEKLDRNLDLLREEPIKLFEELKSYDLETIVHFHGELYLFASHRRFAETDLLYQKIDKETLFSIFSDIKNSYVIHRYTDEGRIFHEYPVTLENRYIRGSKIMGGEHGELICAGLYSDLVRAGAGGTFFFKIDPESGIIYDNRSEAFSYDMLSVLMDLNEPMMTEEELMKYRFTDLILRQNGLILLIAEQLFEQNYNTYNNLIVTYFDTTGQVYWSRVVPKRQDFDISYLAQHEEEVGDYRDFIKETGTIHEYVENYCSYALIAPLNGNDITLVYNDHIRNLVPGEKQRSFSIPRKSYLAAVHITESGAITKYSLQPWKRKSLYPEPMRYYDTLGETIIIPAFKGRKFNYYKITARY